MADITAQVAELLSAPKHKLSQKSKAVARKDNSESWSEDKNNKIKDPDKYTWEEGDIIIEEDEKKKIDDKFNPSQPRYPEGHELGGQWKPSQASNEDHPILGEQELERIKTEIGFSEEVALAQALENFHDDSLIEELTEREMKAFKYYSEDGYKRINGALRMTDYPSEVDEDAVIAGERMISAFDKVAIAEDTVGYRAISISTLKKIEQSDSGTFKDEGFASVTVDKKAADEFGMNTKRMGFTIVTVAIKKGAKALPLGRLSGSEQEFEVLINAGSKYRIVKEQGKVTGLVLV